MRNGLKNTVPSHLRLATELIGSEDPNVVDPSGYQRFCEDLNVDITGVTIHLYTSYTSRCRS